MKKLFLTILMVLSIASFASAEESRILGPPVLNSSVVAQQQAKLKACRVKLGPKASAFAIRNCAGVTRPIQKIRREFRQGRDAVRVERKDILQKRGEFRKNVKATKLQAVQAYKAKRADLRAVTKDGRKEFGERMRKATSDEERAKIKAEFQARRQDFRGQVTATRADFKKNVQARREEFRKKRLEFAKKRLQNMLRRVELYRTKAVKIDERVKVRLEKMKERGINIDKLEAKRLEGVRYINNLDGKIRNLKVLVDKFVSSSDNLNREEVKRIYAEIRKNYIEVRSDLRAYFKNLRELLNEIRQALGLKPRIRRVKPTRISPVQVRPVQARPVSATGVVQPTSVTASTQATVAQ